MGCYTKFRNAGVGKVYQWRVTYIHGEGFAYENADFPSKERFPTFSQVAQYPTWNELVRDFPIVKCAERFFDDCMVGILPLGQAQELRGLLIAFRRILESDKVIENERYVRLVLRSAVNVVDQILDACGEKDEC